jgi:hypothetical protein
MMRDYILRRSLKDSNLLFVFKMLARTLFNQIFLFKPSHIPLSSLSASTRSITTAARVIFMFIF